MVVKQVGDYKIKKEGSFYKVYRKRTVIGSFLWLNEAEKYIEMKMSI